MKTKALIAVVVLGNLAGEAVTFFGGFANTTGWNVAKVPCECAWTVLAFPFGWLGLLGGSFAATRWLLPYPYLFLWAGVAMNACLWGWVAYRFVKYARGQAGFTGFDASAISSRLAEVRVNHVVSAHSRWRFPKARNGRVREARRAVSQSSFFFRGEPGRQEPAEAEAPKT